MIHTTCITLSISEPREKKKNCYTIRAKIAPLLLIKSSLGDRASYDIEMGWDLSPEMDNPVTAELASCRSLDPREEEKVCFLQLTAPPRPPKGKIVPSQACMDYSSRIHHLPCHSSPGPRDRVSGRTKQQCDTNMNSIGKTYQQSWRSIPLHSCWKYNGRTALSMSATMLFICDISGNFY